MRRTRWFPVEQSPVRPGAYEFKGRGLPIPVRYIWDGREWGYWIDTKGGQRWMQVHRVGPGDCWRGLTQPAE